MTMTDITSGMREIVGLRDVGCTGVTLRVIAELRPVAGDPGRMRDRLTWFRRELSGYATLWHLERALAPEAAGADAVPVLDGFADRLRSDAVAAAAAAAAVLARRGGGIRTAPSSGVVRDVLSRLGERPGPAATGLAGADAISPETVLNAWGTKELAYDLPTFVVTTSTRLVPSAVFRTLHHPLFEPIPLSAFEAVVVNGEVLTPPEASHRARSL